MVYKRKPMFICGGDFILQPRSDCPNYVHNWPLASGYVDASDMAERRIRTGWTNPRCPDCHLHGWTPGKLHDTDAIAYPRNADA